MDFGFIAGDTDATIYVRLRDSTTGLAKTGLAFNSAGAVCSYVLPGAARAAITLATQTVTGAHSDGGFVEVDATNCKGLYRLDLPDAAIASGRYSLISIEFDGIIEETVIVPLSLRKSDLRQVIGDAQSATDLKDFADAGYDPSTNKVQGVVLVDTLTTYTSNTPQTGDSFAYLGTNLGALGANATEAGGTGDHLTALQLASDGLENVTAWTVDVTGDITGNLSGSVGSVTGAVGSVTGNVGGNVAGSVASVTAGVSLADDAITAAKFDQSTAFPLTSADSGSTAVARTGADSDTLETLSGQIDGVSTGANPNVILEAEIATVTNQTTFTLATGADHDNAYADQTIVLYDDSNSDYPSVRVIASYTGSSKTVVINEAADFTVGTDDSVRIFATAPGTTAPTAAEVRAEIDSNSTQLAAIVSAIADVPTVSEFEARTIEAADYFDPATDKVTLADGVAHGGSTATLRLGASSGAAFRVSSDDGDAVWFAAGGSSGAAIRAQGAGSGYGIIAVGGTTGEGIRAQGGSSSGFGLNSVSAVGASTRFGTITGTIQASEVLGGINTGAGTITTLDALDTAQDTQHGTTRTAISTAQADLDILTGADGVILATAQANYAPAKAGDEMDLVDAPNSTAVTAIQDGLSTFDASADTVANVTTVGSVTTKTGYKLASDGMDLVIPQDPGTTIPTLGTSSIVAWNAYFAAWSVHEVNSDADSVNLRNSADTDDLAAHAVSDDGTTFVSGAAS